MTHATCKPGYNRFFDTFFDETYDYDKYYQNRSIQPRARVYDNDKTLSVELEMPGVDKKDITLEVKDNILEVKGNKAALSKEEKPKYYFNEISNANYARSFKLGDTVSREGIKATFENGILNVTLQKTEKAQAISVAVE